MLLVGLLSTDSKMLSHTEYERVVRAIKWYAPWLRNASTKVTGLDLVRLDDARGYTKLDLVRLDDARGYTKCENSVNEVNKASMSMGMPIDVVMRGATQSSRTGKITKYFCHIIAQTGLSHRPRSFSLSFYLGSQKRIIPPDVIQAYLFISKFNCYI